MSAYTKHELCDIIKSGNTVNTEQIRYKNNRNTFYSSDIENKFIPANFYNDTNFVSLACHNKNIKFLKNCVSIPDIELKHGAMKKFAIGDNIFHEILEKYLESFEKDYMNILQELMLNNAKINEECFYDIYDSKKYIIKNCTNLSNIKKILKYFIKHKTDILIDETQLDDYQSFEESELNDEDDIFNETIERMKS